MNITDDKSDLEVIQSVLEDSQDNPVQDSDAMIVIDVEGDEILLDKDKLEV